MPNCMLWNIIAIKLTNFICFSLQSNVAFAIGRLMFPVSPNLEGFVFFFKMYLCWKRDVLSHLIILLTFSSNSLSPQGKNVRVSIPFFSFYSFTQSIPREEKSLIWFFRASHLTLWHDCHFGHFISFCLPLWSRDRVPNQWSWMNNSFQASTAGFIVFNSAEEKNRYLNSVSVLCLAFSSVLPDILAFGVTGYSFSISLETLYMFSSERNLKAHLYHLNLGSWVWVCAL